VNSEMTHQRGVGLIEVLIASLVLAVAVVGTSMLLVDSVRSLSDASIRSDALLASADCLEAGRSILVAVMPHNRSPRSAPI